jgi:DNA polymerase-1
MTGGASGAVVNLLDISGFIYRAFFALPRLTFNAQEVGALYGFCNAMLKMGKIFPEAMFIAAFDGRRSNLKRNELAGGSQYKANRKEAPEELIAQIPLIKEAADYFGFTSVSIHGYEADDIIASYVKKLKNKYIINIISSDKDLLQLIDIPNYINIYDPMKQKYITPDDIFAKFGVRNPLLILDLLALTGDSSDNIKGVPGIGPKTAATLINEFGSLDNLARNLDKLPHRKKYDSLKENINMAFDARELVRLRDELDIPFEYKTSVRGDFKEFFNRFEFKALSKNV